MLDLPNDAQRSQILATLLKGEACGDVDVERLAAETEGFTGSDLKNLCIKAAYQPVHDLLAREQALAREHAVSIELDGAAAAAKGAYGRRPAAAPRLGGDQLRPLAFSDFEFARKAIRVSVSKKSAERDVLMKWHERFGEGTTHKDIERMGF